MIKENIPVLVHQAKQMNSILGKIIRRGNQIIGFSELTTITVDQEAEFNSKLASISSSYVDVDAAIREAFQATEPLPLPEE